MNIQPEIKSRCQELLEEQKLGRKEIREFISKATVAMGDPTRCLEPWDWTFNETWYREGRWSKTFDLPCPLLAQFKGFYPQQKVIIVLWFFDCFIGLWIKPYPESKSTYYLYSCRSTCEPKSNWKTSLMFQKIAIELPKVIASVKKEPVYDEAKQKQIEVIPVLELGEKINQAFKGICKTLGAKPL